MREVGLSLLTPNGDIKPFSAFLNDVKAINDRYNHNYLRAEYQQAVAASQMAVRWHEFEKDGDRYDLQYRTANDSRVREEHAILHNIALNRKKYEELKKDPNYKDVEFNPVTGALKATHVGHKEHPNDKKTYFDEKLTGDDLEKECQSEIFRMGGSCILRDESKLLGKGRHATSLDAYINGSLTDIRSITEHGKDYVSQLQAKNKQIGRWNHQNPNEKASTVTLYFHEPSFFSMEKLEESVKGLKKLRKMAPVTNKPTNEFIQVRIKKILVVIRGYDGILVYNVPE